MSDPFADEEFAADPRPLSARAMASAPATAPQTPYLDTLNPAQREAVEALDGPLLVLAGAGTGKTRVLTTRLAHLLRTGRARPNEILCVTFTNKAAREMRERIGALVGHAVEGMPWLGTFHSVSAKILRRHAELVDLQSNFTILDTDDQIRRTRTSRNTCGCACWPRKTATSAAWATMTSPSMAGAGPRWATSCVSRAIFPARRPFGWSRITAPPRISSPSPMASSRATRSA